MGSEMCIRDRRIQAMADANADAQAEVEAEADYQAEEDVEMEDAPSPSAAADDDQSDQEYRGSVSDAASNGSQYASLDMEDYMVVNAPAHAPAYAGPMIQSGRASTNHSSDGDADTESDSYLYGQGIDDYATGLGYTPVQLPQNTGEYHNTGRFQLTNQYQIGPWAENPGEFYPASDHRDMLGEYDNEQFEFQTLPGEVLPLVHETETGEILLIDAEPAPAQRAIPDADDSAYSFISPEFRQRRDVIDILKADLDELDSLKAAGCVDPREYWQQQIEQRQRAEEEERQEREREQHQREFIQQLFADIDDLAAPRPITSASGSSLSSHATSEFASIIERLG